MVAVHGPMAENTIRQFDIPPKPYILIDLQYEQSKPEPDITTFAEIISRDVAMSAAILKQVNSASFGLKRKVTDIKQSVIMLGMNFLTAFATQFHLRSQFNKPSSISHEKFWDTATQTADLMLILLQYLRFKSHCKSEDAYSFGLFRDCGIPLMAMKYANYKTVLIEANQTPERNFTDIEEQYFPTNHAVVGFYLASTWNIPKSLCQLILQHHQPDFLHTVTNSTTDQQKDLFALSKIAVNLLSHYKTGQNDGEWLQTKDDVMAYFYLSDMDYTELSEDVLEQFKERLKNEE